MPWRTVHRLAAAFVAVLVARFYGSLTSPIPLGDEAPYLEAMRHLLAGDSPYTGFGYFYPPAFAVLGAQILDAVGQPILLAILRLANLLGAAYLTACSVVCLRLADRTRWLVGAVVLAVSPAVSLAFHWGNLSPAIAGLAVAALIDWPRRLWLAAIGVSVATAIKPMTAVALLVLPLSRWLAKGRLVALSPWIVAAGVQLVALWIGRPYLGDFLGQDGGWPTATRSVALQRLVHLCGVELRASSILLAVTVLAIVATIAISRRGRLTPRATLALAVGASLLATPVIWSHTLLLAMPFQAMAADRVLQRWRRAGASADGRSPWRRWEPAFIGLAILALHLEEGIGGIELMPTPVLIAATLAVHAALAAVLVVAAGSDGSADDQAV